MVTEKAHSETEARQQAKTQTMKMLGERAVTRRCNGESRRRRARAPPAPERRVERWASIVELGSVLMLLTNRSYKCSNFSNSHLFKIDNFSLLTKYEIDCIESSSFESN